MKTILIVEDIEINIDLLVQILEDDYNLLVARDGVEAVELADQFAPDLILMDISLPRMDGYDATRAIRQTFKALPIIGVSAHAMTDDARKAKEAGCTDYLTKPVDEELLLALLEHYLG